MLFIYFHHFLPVVEICFLSEYLGIVFLYMQVECLIYGNCTAKDATDLYNYVIERLKKDCNTRWWSFFEAQYHKFSVADLWHFGTDPDPYLWLTIRISILLFSSATKNYFCFNFFCLFLFEATFTSFFKDFNSSRSHKTIAIKEFSNYSCLNCSSY